MKILACYSMKGGVGKTASAVNIAYWAAKSGYRTLLIDLDPQGASSFYFRVKSSPKKDWGGRFFKAYGQILKQIKASEFNHLDVIPAHLSFRNFDILLGQIGKRKNRMRQALKGLKKEYDLIILDCPPTISQLAENIFSAANMVLVPVIPTTLSERTFGQLLRFFKEEDYNRKKLIPFFTMADGRKQLHKETAISMRKRYKYFLRNAIPYSTDVEKMGKFRAPIDVFAPGKQANKAYRALWQEIEITIKDR